MHSESSGNINYWPGFVDAFSNLVLALVFVIVILAMSLGMFSISWLSAVCDTAMPVPRVACSISRFCRSMFCDQM